MADTVSFLMKQAGRFPLLTPEQELMLGRRVQAWVELRELDPAELTTQQKRSLRSGRRAFEKMYLSNIRLVITVAAKYARFCKTLGMEDLIQEGCVGLARAVEKFDAERGYKFSTYSYWWIRQAVTRAINQTDRSIRLPMDATDALRKVGRFVTEYREEHGRSPSLELCSEISGISAERIKDFLPHAQGTRSLDDRAKADDDQTSALVDLIACDRETPWEHAEQEDRSRLIEDLLKKLTEPQLSVINSHWGLNGHQQKTLREISQSSKRSAWESTRQLNKRAMLRLRQHAGVISKEAS